MKTNKQFWLTVAFVTALTVSGPIHAQMKGQGGGGGGGGGQGSQNSTIERPDDWMEMSQEERQTFMQSQGMEAGENRSMNENRPEGMEDDMTEAEQEAFRAAKQSENQNTNAGNASGQMNQAQNRFTHNAKKAENYTKFTKQLREKKQFKDEAKIQNKAAVEFLQQRGILDGYEDGTFGPENPINRAESLKVLLESLGESPDEITETEFSDVPADAWFAGYVNKAKRQGIVKGYEDGTFKPAKTVNQVELLKVAFESFGIDLADYPITDLPTASDMDAWYAPYLQYAIDNNLLDIENVDPAEGMTREAFSEVMYRLIQQQESLE